jgi:acyl-CoA synthetase (AMP-forming)/AMP-acid ligase II
MRRAILTIALLVLAPLTALAQSDPVTLMVGTQHKMRAILYRPNGPGPYPGVLVLHASSGLTDRDTTYAERLAGSGYVALVPAFMEAYGLTEASPVVACNPMDIAEFSGCCGVPLPSTEIAIRDEEGADLPIGQAGELCVRGPQIMKGYWNRPSETRVAMTADGFFRTGDIATIDESGFLRIVDRKKDMINVSGMKVYPTEVEEVALMHPGVAEAGAIGVPHPFSGETVKIVIVARDPSLTAADVIAHCRRRLAAYKAPRHVEFRRELPKTALGKVLRRALREPATTEASGGDGAQPMSGLPGAPA